MAPPNPQMSAINPQILMALLAQLGGTQQAAPIGGPQLSASTPRQGAPGGGGPMIPPAGPQPAVAQNGNLAQLAQLAPIIEKLKSSGLFGTSYSPGSSMSSFGGDQNYSYGDMGGGGGLLAGLFR